MKKSLMILTLLGAITSASIQAMNSEAGPSSQEATPPSYDDVIANDLIVELGKVSDRSAAQKVIVKLKDLMSQVTAPTRAKIKQALREYKAQGLREIETRTGTEPQLTPTGTEPQLTPMQKESLSKLIHEKKEKEAKLRGAINPIKRKVLKDEIEFLDYKINLIFIEARSSREEHPDDNPLYMSLDNPKHPFYKKQSK